MSLKAILQRYIRSRIVLYVPPWLEHFYYFHEHIQSCQAGNFELSASRHKMTIDDKSFCFILMLKLGSSLSGPYTVTSKNSHVHLLQSEVRANRQTIEKPAGTLKLVSRGGG